MPEVPDRRTGKFGLDIIISDHKAKYPDAVRLELQRAQQKLREAVEWAVSDGRSYSVAFAPTVEINGRTEYRAIVLLLDAQQAEVGEEIAESAIADLLDLLGNDGRTTVRIRPASNWHTPDAPDRIFQKQGLGVWIRTF